MELDLSLRIIDIFFTVIIPIIIKLLYDISKIYLEIKENIIYHHKDIENIKDDIKELKQCLSETKKILISKNNN